MSAESRVTICGASDVPVTHAPVEARPGHQGWLSDSLRSVDKLPTHSPDERRLMTLWADTWARLRPESSGRWVSIQQMGRLGAV